MNQSSESNTWVEKSIAVVTSFIANIAIPFLNGHIGDLIEWGLHTVGAVATAVVILLVTHFVKKKLK